MLTGNIAPPNVVGQLDFLPLEFNKNGGVVRKPELDAVIARGEASGGRSRPDHRSVCDLSWLEQRPRRSDHAVREHLCAAAQRDRASNPVSDKMSGVPPRSSVSSGRRSAGTTTS